MRQSWLAILLCLLALTAGAVWAEDAPKDASKDDASDDRGAVERIAWFTSLKQARRVAEETGRPLFIAMHVRPYVASPDASQRMDAWIRAYRDPRLVEMSRECACVLRVISAPEGRDPDVDASAASASHLVVDGASRILVRQDGELDAVGGVGGLLRLLRRGLRAHGQVPEGAPLIDRSRVARSKRQIQGLGPLNPIGVPLDASGVRVRLHWELPAPALEGATSTRILADVAMRWDGAGPWTLDQIAFEAGAEVDFPIDMRFAELEGLAELATEGTHRVDLYLVPRPGSYPFSEGPLHVGRVWINLGEGGGGGGGGDQESEQPEEEQPQPPQPMPDEEGPREPDPPPEAPRTEVVKAFQNEGETVDKEDAVVAVEDPDGGVKPLRRVPIQEALRTFEKQAERAVRREDISPRDREFFRSYFAFVAEEARKRAGKKAPSASPAPPRDQPGAGK